MSEEKWRVIRRSHPLGSTPVYQCAVFKFGKWIPLGPWAYDFGDLVEDLDAMRWACDQPVVAVDESEVG